ncbi:MAG TPA: ABC transporter substrate-binding protein [Chloroflexia bacterium]|nr:ABC transporter substrate-binding protein [Chloroflexia bacterium]
MKKACSILAVAMLAITTLSACDSATSSVSTPTTITAQPTAVTIALGYIPDVQFAPFYVAYNKGYYKAEGLDVTLRNGIVPDLVKELGAGENNVSFAAVSGDELIQARSQGIPVVQVMTWYRQYPVAAASIQGKGPNLESPPNLKGLKVGVPGPYGATYVGLQALLKSAGLTLNDVKMESISFTQVESLVAGQVDVAMVYVANEPTQLRSKGFNVSTLLVSDYMQLASNGLATNEKTLKDNPELVRKVVRATLKGIQDTIDNPTDAFDQSIKQVPGAGGDNRELQMRVLEETIKLMQPKEGDPAAAQPLGWTDPDVWAATQDFLFDAKLTTKKGDVNEMFTNQFIEGVKETGAGTGEGKMKARPADFAVEYYWQAGSMPPPYHYEYTISIDSKGGSKIVYWPDYPSDKIESWTEPIAITDSDLDSLYALVASKRLLRNEWSRMDSPPIGGSTQSAEIQAFDTAYKIPSDINEEEEAVVGEVYDAIKALVPQATWDKLSAQREQYEKEYAEKNK